MSRGLAYVGKVTKVSPIENADRIEAAEVVCGEGGKWSGVVGKGQFTTGSLCTVLLQDAIVPKIPKFAFLEKNGWRVKMQRFRGVPSECVITEVDGEYPIGFDLTVNLGIEKYEKIMHPSLAGVARGNFPPFIPKTDEPNFQSSGRLVEALRGKPWYATVKCDGSSTTAYRVDDHFGVCSRNLEKVAGDCAFWSVAKKYDLEKKLPNWIALQWETCGPGIQKNPMGLKAVDGFAFQAWDIKNKCYLSHVELFHLCDSLGFPMAEMVASGDSFDLDADGLRALAEGTYPNGKQREGVVVRPYTEEYVKCQRLSFKALNLLYKDA